MANMLLNLALRARKRLPEPVRRVLRMGSHLRAQAPASPDLPPELITGCAVHASRYDLAMSLPRQARVAEVGVHLGDFARHILVNCDPEHLLLIDLDLSRIDPILPADPRVVLSESLSHTALAGLADASYDWIYIDADHSYEGCRRDAEAAASKVKPGGYLIFNDFAHVDPGLGVYGVHRAVVEFAVAHRWPFAGLAYHPSALYDVALRRPVD